jgi:hypothetical protein
MLRQLHPAALAAVSLALFIAVVPRADAATRAVFGGVTSQDAAFAITVDTKAHRVRGVDLYLEGDCAGGAAVFGEHGRFARTQPGMDVLFDDVFTGGRIKHSGRFSASGTVMTTYGGDPAMVTQQLSGRVRGRSAGGTLSAHLERFDAATGDTAASCDVGPVNWSAASAPKRIYAGSTDDEWPVVLELASDRQTVAALRLPWQADCPSGAWFAIPDTLKGFALEGATASETWTDTVNLSSGGQRRFAYDVQTTVKGRRAKGTATNSITDVGTTADETCGPSTTRWTAQSS